MNVLPPLCTILCHLWLQIELLHVVFDTFKPCLSWPSSATFFFPLNISAGTYPLLPYHTLHMSKPTQSTSRHHFHHTLNTQTRAQVFSSYQTTSLHTSFLPSTLGLAFLYPCLLIELRLSLDTVWERLLLFISLPTLIYLNQSSTSTASEL